MSLFHSFMKKPAGSDFIARTCMSSSNLARQEGKVTSNCQVVNYLLATCVTDDIIAEDNMDIVNFKQPVGQSAVEYPQALWTEALRGGPVFDEYHLKAEFIKGLKHSIWQSVRSYWAKNKSA